MPKIVSRTNTKEYDENYNKIDWSNHKKDSEAEKEDKKHTSIEEDKQSLGNPEE